MTGIKDILKKEIEYIKPPGEIIKKISKISNETVISFEKKLADKKIDAEVFIGGSIAKKTLVKKDKYDIDVFIRFNKKYIEISDILGKLLGKKARRVHGSRDYYHMVNDEIILEIIPVIKIKKPEEALNVTDLSYFHVNFVLDKIKKNKKLADEIILAKAFCHAQDCYGAESYINGFSGYALELLIIHYGSFLKFLKEISRANKKIIIDDSHFFRKKEDILREVNEAKVQNPIVLIDPTYKGRNALASLSNETFFKFKEAASLFLKNPSHEFFIKKDIFNEMKAKYDGKIVTIAIKTNKQAGDIAGTKSKKFFRFFLSILKKEFIIKAEEFHYDDKKNTAYFYLVHEKKPKEVIRGPPITHTAGLTAFKKAHPDAFIKDHFSFANISHDLSFDEFLKKFMEKYSKIIKQMSIKDIYLENN